MPERGLSWSAAVSRLPLRTASLERRGGRHSGTGMATSVTPVTSGGGQVYCRSTTCAENEACLRPPRHGVRAVRPGCSPRAGAEVPILVHRWTRMGALAQRCGAAGVNGSHAHGQSKPCHPVTASPTCPVPDSAGAPLERRRRLRPPEPIRRVAASQAAFSRRRQCAPFSDTRPQPEGAGASREPRAHRRQCSLIRIPSRLRKRRRRLRRMPSCASGLRVHRSPSASPRSSPARRRCVKG